MAPEFSKIIMHMIRSVVLTLFVSTSVGAQVTNDPFPEPIPVSEGAIVVGLEEFTTLPNVNGATARPMVLVDEPGSGRFFVNDMWGILHSISYDGGVTQYLDIREPGWGVLVESPPEVALIMELGLQSFAFHPQFSVSGTAGYGKLYTWLDTDDTRPEPDFVPGGGQDTHDLVLLEWTAVDPNSSTYDGGPPRELMRIEQPFDNHNGGRIGFNHLSEPGDSDFGLLYIGMADGGAAGDELDVAQNLGSLFGKVLRIHPLGSNSANGRYGVPAENPYARDGVDRTLGEIYASGVRNPQGFDWDSVTGDLLLADIGQSVVETLNRVPAGADLGWNTWEGSFIYASQTRVDTSNPRGEPWITYPLAEYDQQDPLLQRGSAATGVVAYRDNAIPQLTDRVIWGDLPSGEVFHVPADGLEGGGQSSVRRVLFRNDGETKTLLQLVREKNAEQGREPTPRVDLHFGRSHDGRIFLLNKWDGVIREIVP
jgi:hypothetical protein|tara:strand:- start:60051 stop:61496 length:1446 start_codon:yes stop_codon:yes gene_type:complete